MQSLIESTGAFTDAAKNIRVKSRLYRDGPYSWIEGKLRNNGTAAYKGMIYFDLLDSEGRPIGSACTLIGPVQAGEILRFRTDTVNNTAVSDYRLNYIIGGCVRLTIRIRP
ncbi:FxLYD domain-containing protein, partial [Methanoregula sp.]|uniref:FxLYD domain-containing protein n=1 Tax=Methanoregula sp. TaxID=2052170 RepID=UPI0025E38DC5